MVWRRRNTASRKEPRFGFTGSLAELRLAGRDRFGAGDDAREASKSMSKRRIVVDDEEEDEAPPPPREKSRKRKKKSRSGRGLLGNAVYWGLVLGLWGVIAVIGTIVWVGAHLPPIQSLAVPKRPPTI